MKIAIGNDHAGFETKLELIKWLKTRYNTITDFGAFSNESVDYPDYAHAVARAVKNREYDFGVLICGSGQGVSLSANKHKSIRAALCWHEEIARLSRQHNNANILCLPGRFLTINQSIEILNTFLDTPFEGGRHQARVEKISMV